MFWEVCYYQFRKIEMEVIDVWDYSRLKGRTKEAGLRQEDVGTAIGLTPTTYSLKLNNKAEFRQNEIEGICRVLSIPFADIPSYFFTMKV